MSEFLSLVPPAAALETFLAHLKDRDPRPLEKLATKEALGRVLAEAIEAPEPLPSFPRSTVDGYAVRAKDTFGASTSLPAYLKIAGEVPMGKAAGNSLEPEEAMIVHTGGMIPPGADAVVMLEDTQALSEQEIEVLKPAADGENVLRQGEDVQPGDLLLERGDLLRPQEIGGLMALGITEVPVLTKASVGIISSGDEVIPPEQTPQPGQVRDVNSYTLRSLVERAGGEPILFGIVPDDFDGLFKIVQRAVEECDLVVVTAGSSVSARDRTAEILDGLGEPGVLIHGVSIKPGKPTILAVADGTPMIGLPGNPVSALVVAGLFVIPVLHRLHERKLTGWDCTIEATLTINMASESGREDYFPVRLSPSNSGLLAEPIFGRSNLIFTLVRADGLVRIPPEATGLQAGEVVQILLI